MKKELVCDSRDGFWFHSIFHYQGAALKKEAIVIDSKQTERFVRYIKKNRIDKVIIDLWDSDIVNLDFVKQLDNIKYLSIWGKDSVDYTPIYYLEQLKFLTLTNTYDLDISKFPNLEFLSTNNIEHIHSINKLKKIKSLKLIDTTSSFSMFDLQFLSKLVELEVLHLDGLRITSVAGLEHLNELRVLSLVNLDKLVDITALRDASSSITSLTIFNCRNILDISCISELKKLQYLSLTKIKEIPSINFLKKNRKLYTFILTETSVLDPNLSVLKNIPDVIVLPMKKVYYVNNDGYIDKPSFNSKVYQNRKTGTDNIDLWRRIDY